VATYGELRARLAQMAPGIPLDLLDGWIQDRYQSILDRLNWQRLEVRQTLQTVAEFNTGTVDATNAATALTGTGTGWTAGLSNRLIRIAERPEYYNFTYVGATSATLERGYEGETAAGLSYRINQSVYGFSADTRYVEAVVSFETGLPLLKSSPAELNRLDGARQVYGTPSRWAPFMDTFTDPPAPQIELWPVSVTAEGFLVELVTEVAALGATGVSLLPWVRPAALVEGVMADIRRHEKDHNSAREHEAAHNARVIEMAAVEAHRQGPVAFRQPDCYTAHRRKRWTR